MFELSVKGRFSAAHRLRDYEGACAAIHGHNWDVEVFVRGEALDERGMLVDFRELRSRMREALEALDHADLNAVDMLAGRNPTSENIVQCLYEHLSGSLNTDGCRVHKVSVNETPEARASYWE